MRKQVSKFIFVTLSLVLLAGSGPAMVLAEDVTTPGSDVTNNSSDSTTITSTDNHTEINHKSQVSSSSSSATESGANDGGKLSSGKLKSCENRQANINKVLNHIVTRGQKQLTLFSTIAERVEKFKTSKNLTVSNYDQLLATLETDKTKATNDLAAMKTIDTVDCNGTDPKGMVNNFKTDLQQEISDLKTYKTDVKNLIVAVKTAAGTTDKNSSGGNQ